MVYLDTSILTAYYCPEVCSRAVDAFLAKQPGPAISVLGEVEFCSALNLKVRTGGLDRAEAQRVLARFRRHVHEGAYRMLALQQGQLAQACQWLARFDTTLRTLDALHLAIAFMNEARLITADKQLARSARAIDVDFHLVH